MTNTATLKTEVDTAITYANQACAIANQACTTSVSSNSRSITPLAFASSTTMSCKSETIWNFLLFEPESIVDVEFHPPATKMIFKDGTFVTAVARDGDEFNKEIGIMVCILKRMFGGSGYNNLFRKWIKNDEKKKKDIERANKETEEKKITRERQRAKKIKKKIEKRKAAEQRQAEIQKQAFLEALKEWSLMPLENMLPGEED